MKQKLTKNKKRILFSIIAFGIFFVAHHFHNKFLDEYYSKMDTLAQKEVEYSAIGDQEAYTAAANEKNAATNAEIDELEPYIVRPISVPDEIDYINEFAEECGITIKGIEVYNNQELFGDPDPNSVGIGETNATQTEATTDTTTPPTEEGISVNIEGTDYYAKYCTYVIKFTSSSPENIFEFLGFADQEDKKYTLTGLDFTYDEYNQMYTGQVMFTTPLLLESSTSS